MIFLNNPGLWSEAFGSSYSMWHVSHCVHKALWILFCTHSLTLHGCASLDQGNSHWANILLLTLSFNDIQVVCGLVRHRYSTKMNWCTTWRELKIHSLSHSKLKELADFDLNCLAFGHGLQISSCWLAVVWKGDKKPYLTVATLS